MHFPNMCCGFETFIFRLFPLENESGRTFGKAVNTNTEIIFRPQDEKFTNVAFEFSVSVRIEGGKMKFLNLQTNSQSMQLSACCGLAHRERSAGISPFHH